MSVVDETIAAYDRDAAVLPIGADASFDCAFAGLEWRQLRVGQDQQAPEWAGVRSTARRQDEAGNG